MNVGQGCKVWGGRPSNSGALTYIASIFKFGIYFDYLS